MWFLPLQRRTDVCTPATICLPETEDDLEVLGIDAGSLAPVCPRATGGQVFSTCTCALTHMSCQKWPSPKVTLEWLEHTCAIQT